VRTISVAAHKGGVGKTTTALALASAFARAGDPTLLIDIDPQGHSTIGIGVDVPDGAPTVREVYSDQPLPASAAIVPTSVPNLSLLPATIRLERLAHALYMRPRRETVLATALRPLRHAFRWTVIDCPPSLGALTETAIAAADVVIIPCRMEARASDGLVDLLELIAVLKGESWASWRILLTQVDRRRSRTNDAVRAALSTYQHQTFETIVPQSEPLNHAQIVRVDCFAFDPQCSGSLAYAALATELRTLPLWQKPEPVASSI
jgi:chromosome partitioning protein